MTKAEPVTVPEVDTTDVRSLDTWFKGTGSAEVEPIDTTEMQRAQLERILSGSTAEEILKQDTTTPSDDIIGQTLVIRGYSRLPSTKADSALRFYLLIDAVDPDGEVLQVTCGALKVMARIIALSANGFLPCYAAITRSAKPTSNGNYVLDLEPRSADDAAREAGKKTKDF